MSIAKIMALNENNTNYSVSNQEIQNLSNEAQKYSEKFAGIFDETHKVIIGQEDALHKILISIIADGHVLLESVPLLKHFDGKNNGTEFQC